MADAVAAFVRWRCRVRYPMPFRVSSMRGAGGGEGGPENESIQKQNETCRRYVSLCKNIKTEGSGCQSSHAATQVSYPCARISAGKLIVQAGYRTRPGKPSPLNYPTHPAASFPREVNQSKQILSETRPISHFDNHSHCRYRLPGAACCLSQHQRLQ